MTEGTEPAYRVTLRDVDGKVDSVRAELAELKTILQERVPLNLDERLRAREAKDIEQDGRLTALEGDRAPRISAWTIIAALAALVAVAVVIIREIAT